MSHSAPLGQNKQPERSEGWRRVSDLFAGAVALAESERTRFLAEECAEDGALRAEVESLLASDAESSEFIEEPVGNVPLELFSESNSEIAGQQFGAYRIMREIGRGGLGTVYLAARADDEYRKEVALKLVRRGLDTDDILRRFRHERQILARLEHPNIARLIDGGTTDDGLPYFVMEYVRGRTLLEFCDAQELGTNARLQLFRKVCDAVSYAHQNLVIHRDLKPSNILVTDDPESVRERGGTPKLLDFGIAKLLTPDEEAMTQTIPALRVMTPEYASPEQVKSGRITTSTDVYSLGVILYELLTGQKPYRLTSRTGEEISRAITDQEPERPSAVRSASFQLAEFPNLKSWATSLRGDLDNIVLMALRKEPERRYATVERFSEDIRRHLAGLPVSARHDTFSYRAQKFIQRNKAGVAAAAVVFLTLVSGIVVTLVQAERVVQERNRARQEAAKASRINTFLQDVLAFSDPSWNSSNPNRDRAATVAEALEIAGRRAESELADQPEVAAAVHFTVGWTYKSMGKLDEAEPHLRKALALRRRVLPENDQDVAQSLVGVGELHMMRGRNEEAEALDREAVAIYRRAQATGEVDTKWFAAALSNLAYTLVFKKGEQAASEKLFLEALQVTSSLQGIERAPVSIIYSNLAVIRNAQGDLDGASVYIQKSVEEQRRLPGDPRRGMANTLNNLGALLSIKGDLAGAEKALQEALEINLETVGENHQLTAWALGNLANVHNQTGEYARARDEARRAFGIQEQVLPAEHTDFLRAWIPLGAALTHLGEMAKAESYLRRGLAIGGAKLPAGDRMLALIKGGLGENLLAQGRLAEAEGFLQASYDAARAQLGEKHPETVRAAERLRELARAR